MTECERLIAEGKFSSDYFEEEIRDEYLVTVQRKKLWAVQLDLLLKFDEICKKHNLQYWLDGGTLLGAVRHKGFIPWDDDIDVCMHRKDYEVFLSLSKEFIDPYFLQTPYTDKESAYSFAKLRNSNTTMISSLFVFQNMNHGICIDIFPIDNWALAGGEERYKRIKYLCLQNSTYMRMRNPHLSIQDKVRVSQWEGRNPIEVYEEIRFIAMQYNEYNTRFIAKAVTTNYPLHKRVMNKEDFLDVIDGEFEGHVFPIPVGYDRKLSIKYGNYMEFPPIDKRGNWHTGLYIDPDTPYKESQNILRNRINDGV